LTFSLSNERVRGTELNSDFGEENVNINFQNLITLPLVCGLTSGLMTALSSRLAFLSGIGIGECRGIALLTLTLNAVFMAFSVSSDSTFSLRIFKNKLLLIAAPVVVAMSLLIIFTPISTVLGMACPHASKLAVAVVSGLFPCLLSFGIRLVKKYVFNIKNKEI
jgi:magnesium-transporting ATPase (P-type)